MTAKMDRKGFIASAAAAVALAAVPTAVLPKPIELPVDRLWHIDDWTATVDAFRRGVNEYAGHVGSLESHVFKGTFQMSGYGLNVSFMMQMPIDRLCRYLSFGWRATRDGGPMAGGREYGNALTLDMLQPRDLVIELAHANGRALAENAHYTMGIVDGNIVTAEQFNRYKATAHITL